MINVIEQLFREAVNNAVEIVNSVFDEQELVAEVVKYGLSTVVYDHTHNQLGLWMTGDLDDGFQLTLPAVTVQWIKDYINSHYKLNDQNEIVLK